MKKALIFALVFIFSGITTFSWAYTDNDVKRMSGYASVLGRAVACGINVDKESYRVAAWLDATFREQSEQFSQEFLAVAAQNAQMQKTGKASEDCKKVAVIVQGIIWP